MFEQTFKNIDDILWKESGCSSELDYTEQSSWLLFLKYLDGLEQDKATEAEIEGEYVKTRVSLLGAKRNETKQIPKNRRLRTCGAHLKSRMLFSVYFIRLPISYRNAYVTAEPSAASSQKNIFRVTR